MLDQLVLLITSLFTIIALFRGFIREFLGLVGIICAVLITYYGASYVALLFLYKIPSMLFAKFIAGTALFLVSLIFMSVVNSFLLSLLKNVRHSLIDSILGGLLGFMKGYFICFMLYIVVYLSVPVLNPDIEPNEAYDPMLPNWLKKSRSYPIFYQTKTYLETVVRVQHRSAEQSSFQKQSFQIFSDTSNEHQQW